MAALHVVEETKALLDEAQAWWAFTWALPENQSRVRSAIESATAALDREVEKAKKSWSANWKTAYQGKRADTALNRAARALKEAEAEFDRMTTRAKKMFDEAEKEWNAAKARDGAVLAKEAIEKHEAVLKMAKASVRSA